MHYATVCMTRRRFGYTLCGAWLASRCFVDGLKGAANTSPQPWDGPALVAKVYLGAAQSHWPRTGVDVKKEAAELDARLAEIERKHSGSVRFTGGQVLLDNSEIEAWAKSLGDADAVLAVPVCQPSPSVSVVVDAAKLPTLCFSRPFAGHQWSGIAGLRKSGRRVDVLASSSYGGFDAWAPVFRTIHHLRTSKVLVVAASPAGRQPLTNEFTKQFGTAFSFFTFDDINAAFQKADTAKARQAAEEFTRAALKVVEPTQKEILDAFRFYLMVEGLLEREKANAITLDCFPALLAHKLPAYPCISWSKLNDQGRYGVCEGDVRSTMTQLLVTAHTGMPGFVSDPVFDVSRDEVSHAHCVAATKMRGINGPSSPYLIRHHLETAEGAVLQVVMPVGEKITVGKFSDPRTFLVSTAEVTGTTAEISGSPDAEGGCRTKIRTRVSDAQKWLENYSAGLHRVIFYGDHVAAIERMGRLMGFEVVREI
jgi:hypothetical protein